MEEYSKEDVLTALSSLPKKSRKRVLVDQRSYLIGILAYRFMMSEHVIAKATGVNRYTVNYNKKLALEFHNNKIYMQNVYVYSVMFPFDFGTIEPVSPVNRSIRVEFDIDKKVYNKLKAAGSILGHKDIRVTIQLFLEKSLKLWEE
jgi:hypothetical protein